MLYEDVESERETDGERIHETNKHRETKRNQKDKKEIESY